MMRVTRIERRTGEPALHVEGRLTHETADELASACGLVLDRHGGGELDCTGLQFADPTGIALLHGLAARGMRLSNRSPLLESLLRDGDPSRADAGAAPNPGHTPDAADALETLVREHGARLLATARRLLRDEQEARDAVQEALLSAFRARESFRGAAQLTTWLHRIVVNAALMRLRRRRTRREESIDALLPRFDDTGHFAQPVASWAAPADTLLEQRETRARVRDAIARLPERYRTVILLRDIEELDTDEAAAVLGITANAVKIRLHRARQALRTLLAAGFEAGAADGEVRR